MVYKSLFESFSRRTHSFNRKTKPTNTREIPLRPATISGIIDIKWQKKLQGRWARALAYAERQVAHNRAELIEDADDRADEDYKPAVQEIGEATFPLISNDGTFKSVWDFFQFLFLMYVAIMVPIRVAFDASAIGSMAFVESFIDVYFLVDLFLNFITPYTEEKRDTILLIVSKDKIALNYFRTWFLCDLIAIIPIDSIQSVLEGTFTCTYYTDGCSESSGASKFQMLSMFKVFRIFKLLKLLRLSRMSRILDKYKDDLIYLQATLDALKMGCIILFISHLFGCLYGFVYDWAMFEGDTDQADSDVGGVSIANRYSTSFYWAVQTITTVGYGDMGAGTNVERIICIVTMLFGGFVFSWIISNMNTMLNPDSSSKRFKDRETFVLDFMKSNNLPRAMAARHLAFYNIQNQHALNDKSMLSGVPHLVCAEIFEHMYWSAVRGTKFMRDSNRAFVTAVCMCIQELNIPAKRHLYIRGEIAQELFILQSGSACIVALPVRNKQDVESRKEAECGGGTGGKSKKGIGKLFKHQNEKTLRAAASEEMQARDQVKFDSGSSKRTLMTIAKGAYVGEDALLGLLHRCYNVFASSRLQLLSISKQDWLRLLPLCPGAHDLLMASFLARINRLGLMDHHLNVGEVLRDVQQEHLHLPSKTAVLVRNWQGLMKRVTMPPHGAINRSTPDLFYGAPEDPSQGTPLTLPQRSMTDSAIHMRPESPPGDHPNHQHEAPRGGTARRASRGEDAREDAPARARAAPSGRAAPGPERPAVPPGSAPAASNTTSALEAQVAALTREVAEMKETLQMHIMAQVSEPTPKPPHSSSKVAPLHYAFQPSPGQPPLGASSGKDLLDSLETISGVPVAHALPESPEEYSSGE